MAGTIEFVHPKSKWKLGDRVVAVTTGWRWEDVTYGKPPQLPVTEQTFAEYCGSQAVARHI